VDELWQRYRTFWTPLLIGVGVFLVGLVAVFVTSEDPETAANRVRVEEGNLRRLFESPRKSAAGANAEALQDRVLAWGRRVDQASLEDGTAYAVDAALQAALLRGVAPDVLARAVAGGDAGALARFDDDPVAAARALESYRTMRDDRLGLLRTGDPNVGFSRLLNDVWSELSLRANRADVDLRTAMLGFDTVKSVTRASLAQRLLNLALVAEVVDLGIRSGLQSVDEVRFETRANPEGPDVFIKEWPVSIAVEGDMGALRPILDRITDPRRPLALTKAQLTQPRRGSPLEGRVRLEFTASSVVARPAASLELDKEEQ
jgi:Tfp pilus assembly protein PilO